MKGNNVNFKFKINSLIDNYTPNFFKEFQKIFKLYEWYKFTKSSPPSPHFVKQSILLRHNIIDCSWIETGTYLGFTTQLLSKNSNFVHTIEPSKKCLMLAKYNLRKQKNIFFYEGTSENMLDKVFSKITEQNICIWLDGHFSEGITFKGPIDSPIKKELKIIKKNLPKFERISIFIDDIRSSDKDSKGYPELNYYVEWANSNNLKWHIEQDIFIIKSKSLDTYPKIY